MRLHAQTLVMNTRNKLYERSEDPTEGAIRFGLVESWRTWDYAMRNRYLFGANSFALVALGVILDILQHLGYIDPKNVKLQPLEIDEDE